MYLHMNFGLYSNKARDISFESHLSSLEQEPKQILLEIRDFVKALGSNVIEEIRPHRIVYAKSLTFRTFLDIQPRNNALVVSIRKSRTEPPSVNTIQSPLQSADIKTQIAVAYNSIK
jgi:hypothetical protein